jgi:pyridoxamine 5'-phosphate oxidase
MADWRVTLPGLLARVWQTLGRGVADRRGPARHIALATTSPDGAPQVRTVVLRAADAALGTIDIHTDLRSAKVAALRVRPLAEALVWDPRARLQIRLSGEVAILAGPAAAALWSRVPETARPVYGADPPPGTPIPESLAYTTGDGTAAFAVLRLSLARIEVVHLGDRHRRAAFLRAGGWQGEWLSP